MIRHLDLVGHDIDDFRVVSGRRIGTPAGVDAGAGICRPVVASAEQALQEGGGLAKPAGAGEASRLGHAALQSVIHRRNFRIREQMGKPDPVSR